tara:strand:+ start:29 stop:307 length:279 start_codon:yes stop_codon:yes gene_type:complete
MITDQVVDVLCLAKGYEKYAVPMSLALVFDRDTGRYTTFREDAEDKLHTYFKNHNISDGMAQITDIVFAEIPDKGRRWRVDYSTVRLIEYPE